MNINAIRSLAETARQVGRFEDGAEFEAEQEFTDIRGCIRRDAEYFEADMVQPRTKERAIRLVEIYAQALAGAAARQSAQWEGGYPGTTQRTEARYVGVIEAARQEAQGMTAYGDK